MVNISPSSHTYFWFICLRWGISFISLFLGKCLLKKRCIIEKFWKFHSLPQESLSKPHILREVEMYASVPFGEGYSVILRVDLWSEKAHSGFAHALYHCSTHWGLHWSEGPLQSLFKARAKRWCSPIRSQGPLISFLSILRVQAFWTEQLTHKHWNTSSERSLQIKLIYLLSPFWLVGENEWN